MVFAAVLSAVVFGESRDLCFPGMSVHAKDRCLFLFTVTHLQAFGGGTDELESASFTVAEGFLRIGNLSLNYSLRTNDIMPCI